MRTTKRLLLVLAVAVVTVVGTAATPGTAAADTLCGWTSAGGCLTGIPDVVLGIPLCRVLT